MSIPTRSTTPALTHLEYTFIWPYGGNTLKLAGSFSNWKLLDMLPVEGKPGTFQRVERLSGLEKHQYKFVMDGRWCYDVLKPVATDIQGNINNEIDVGFVLGKKIAVLFNAKAFSVPHSPESTSTFTNLRFIASEGAELYPWHGTWTLSSKPPNITVWTGKWVVADATKAILKFHTERMTTHDSTGSPWHTPQANPGVHPLGFETAEITYDASGQFILTANNGTVLTQIQQQPSKFPT